MRYETRQNTFTLCVNTTPIEIFSPDPSRKAIMLSPIAGGTRDAPGYVSLSYRQDVIPGAGFLNYLTGDSFITILTDHDIGDAIGLPWWIVSTYPVKVQVCEISYVRLADCEGR